MRAAQGGRLVNTAAARTQGFASTRYYADQADEEIAARFFDPAIRVLRAAERMPGIGTPRIGEVADIPGLRMRRVDGFPCGWFYFPDRCRDDGLSTPR